MQYLTLYTAAKKNNNAMPSPEHMEQMGALMKRSFESGVLELAGALGHREKVGLRVSLNDGKFTVTEAPTGESVLLGASGMSIQNAGSPEELITNIKEFLTVSGDGSVEIIGYAFPISRPLEATRTLTSGVIPYLNVDGAGAAADFYRKAFAAKEIARMPAQDGKRLMHCHLEINGGSVMLSDAFPEHGHPHKPLQGCVMHLVVSDGDAWFDRAVKAGCKVIAPLEKQFWGDRYGRLSDPFGVEWAINEPANG